MQITSNHEKTKHESSSKLFIEDTEQNRLLEKEFFKGLVQVFTYILLLAVILEFAYDYSYISLKVHSNDYLKFILTKDTSWHKVLFIHFIYTVKL